MVDATIVPPGALTPIVAAARREQRRGTSRVCGSPDRWNATREVADPLVHSETSNQPERSLRCTSFAQRDAGQCGRGCGTLRGVADLEPSELARAIVELLQWAHEHASEQESDGLAKRLVEHLGGETRGLPVVSRPLEGYQRANFQVAIEAYLSEEGRQAELIGLPMMHGYRVGLAELVNDRSRGPWSAAADAGPIEYEPVEIGERQIMCVAAGLWLVTDRTEGMLLMLRRDDHGPGHAELGIEIMAQDRTSAESLLGELERLMTDLNVYRGRILALSVSPFGGLGVEVRRLPPVRREQIVFPDGVLERIERHTKTFAEHSETLLASGRHLKRGLLLHGPPGTGKTLTAMYLSHLMPDRTVLLLTGEALHAVGPACEMARELAPSMLVLEDVDLVAEDREYGHSTSLLFELLNEMDGLGEDTDIVFVLTTNRPGAIESSAGVPARSGGPRCHDAAS